ncbi:MAG TPA: hypothetical protein VFK13_07230 [Gemmatimonadaceae bacterium]|nr:hypothetical protein [Gemmatimonadaceae bacterium]
MESAVPCTVRLSVVQGAPAVCDSLPGRLTRGFPEMDVLPGDVPSALMLRPRDDVAGDPAVVCERIGRMVQRLNEFHPSDVPLQVRVSVEP